MFTLQIHYSTLVSENKSRLLNASRSSKTLRPSTAFKQRGPIIPSQAVSAFDKFNRDIINNKIPNESVKRLQPKSALLKQKRVMSARKKLAEKQLKGPVTRQRVPSAKQLPFTTSKTKESFGQHYGKQKDEIMNIKIQTV